MFGQNASRCSALQRTAANVHAAPELGTPRAVERPAEAPSSPGTRVAMAAGNLARPRGDVREQGRRGRGKESGWRDGGDNWGGRRRPEA